MSIEAEYEVPKFDPTWTEIYQTQHTLLTGLTFLDDLVGR